MLPMRLLTAAGLLLALATFPGGCGGPVPPAPAAAAGLVEITCRPALVLKIVPGATVADERGHRFNPYILWLKLDDGKNQRSIAWDRIPGESAPVRLSEQETYTFTVADDDKVVRIVKGSEVIYTRAGEKKK